MSRAGDGHCSRVGHRCGGGLGVGWLPVLVGKVAGDQQGGNGDSGEFVSEGAPAVHESDTPPYRFRVGLPEGALISAARSGCAAIASAPSSASNSALVTKRFAPTRR